jgi:hypothetical protein
VGKKRGKYGYNARELISLSIPVPVRVTSFPVMQLPVTSLLHTVPPQMINGWCFYTTVIVYIADKAARFGSTDADEFTLQQQNVKTKAATKYAVKVLSDFMLEYNYDGEKGTMDIVVLNGILQDLYANVRTSKWK